MLCDDDAFFLPQSVAGRDGHFIKQGSLAYLTWPWHTALHHELFLCWKGVLKNLEPALRGTAYHL